MIDIPFPLRGLSYKELIEEVSPFGFVDIEAYGPAAFTIITERPVSDEVRNSINGIRPAGVLILFEVKPQT